MKKKPSHGQGRIRVFPCIVYSLSEVNKGFEEGWRFRVHDIDDETWYFHNADRMYHQLAIHNMHPVTVERMEELRKKRLDRRSKRKGSQ
jgi:hypothetical protein